MFLDRTTLALLTFEWAVGLALAWAVGPPRVSFHFFGLFVVYMSCLRVCATWRSVAVCGVSCGFSAGQRQRPHGGLIAQVDQEHTAQQCRRRTRRIAHIALWLLPAVESCPAPAVRNARCRSHRQRNAHARGQRIIQQKTLSTATRHAASATQLAITNGACPAPPGGPAR